MKTCIILSLLSGLIRFNTVIAQISKDQGKWLGNVINSAAPATFNKYWNQVTPENASKWGSVENTRDLMRWDNLDMIYHYSRTFKIPFKFHTFVWGQQEPAYIKNLSLEEQLKEIESYIIQACERYPDMEMIDVVNEPLHAPPSYKKAIGAEGSTGWDWVVWAFEKARKYCPKAQLLLNDYSILSNDNNTNTYINLIEILKNKKLIDGIGEQGHFFETTPINIIQQNLNKLTATGLPIYLSEFDVHLADDQAQLNKYKELFPVFWQNPAVKGITLWGYHQGQIWRSNAYLVRSDNTERPALEWLKEYISSTTKVVNRSGTDERFKILGNPVQNQILNIFSELNVRSLEIFSLDGRLLFKTIPGTKGYLSILTPDIHGNHIIRVRADGEISVINVFIE